MLTKKQLLVCVIVASIFLIAPLSSASADDVREIIFPVLWDSSLYNDFGAYRVGHTHKGNDLMAPKMTPLVATVDGTIIYSVYPEATWGFMVTIRGEDGYRYNYLHINDDNPGTDDGNGGGMNAYAPDIFYRNKVVAGQLIGWVGDSGNAESTPPHLHFEIVRPDGNWIDPYQTLVNATRIGKPVIPPAMNGELLPFGEFKGGASIAYGQTDISNHVQELIVGAGPGGGPQIRVFTSDNRLLSQFFAYPRNFRGGLHVTTGDINGDGIDEIITGTGNGGGPQVRAFKQDGTVMAQFFAYAKHVRSGVKVASADLNGDGIDEIITGAGPGGGPHVRVFNRAGEVQSQFFAYSETFRGGIDVAAYPATETTPAYIVTGAGPGGGPHVRVFDRWGTLQSQFFAFDKNFRGGVNVDVANVYPSSPTPEIVTAPASKGGAHVRVFSHTTNLVGSYTAYEPWWRGGYDLAVGSDTISIVNKHGNRRTSIRSILD